MLVTNPGAGRGNIRGRALAEITQHVAEHEPCAVSGAGERDRPADAAGGACYDDRATFEHATCARRSARRALRLRLFAFDEFARLAGQDTTQAHDAEIVLVQQLLRARVRMN